MGTEQARVSSASLLRRLPRLLVIAALALFLAVLVYGLTRGPDDTIDKRLDQGRSARAPGFSLEVLEPGQTAPPVSRSLADSKLSLAELRGMPVVLNFWASWCDPCRQEAPLLERGWRRSRGAGVLFLGLDMQDLRGDARAFLREAGITYPTVRDPGKGTASDYGATGIPETYFVSGRGRVVAHVIGVVSSAQLDSGIAAARTGRPLGKEQGGERRKPR